MFIYRHPRFLLDNDEGGGGGGADGGQGPQGAGEGGDANANGGGSAGAGGHTPPWGSPEEFDPEKAWKLITNLRDDLGSLKSERDDLRGKVKQHEDASKSDHEKLEERATGAESRAGKAEAEAARLRVALRKGLTETQAKRLVGDTEEDLEKDADELLASFQRDDDGDDRRRPRERLRPGAAPSSEPEETDPEKLAAKVPRMY